MRILYFATVLTLTFEACLNADDKLPRTLVGDPYAGETKAQHDERMAWWREAKFGAAQMFFCKSG